MFGTALTKLYRCVLLL